MRAADEQLVNFEQFGGPANFTGAQPPLTVGHATFSGGQVLTNVSRLSRVNRTSVYGVWHGCAGCARTITIEFSEPVSDVSLMLMNARMGKLWFEVSDDTGHTAAFVLNPYFLGGSATTVTLPSTGIRTIVVGEVNKTSPFWYFFVDNLRYTIDEGQEYLVSFSAFVPHDNVPAGPTASCLAENDVPPRHVQRGGPWRGKARWRRDANHPGRGKTKGHRVFHKYNDDDHVGHDDHDDARHDDDNHAGHGHDDDNDHGRKRRLYFAGDNRAFDALAPTYRLRQLVTVIPDQSRDTDGIKDGTLRNLAEEVRAFAEDAMADGVIDIADEDGIADDCHLFHQAQLAETDLMNVEVTRTGPQSLELRLMGTLYNPLVGRAQVLGAIDWDFTMTLDASVEPARWTVTGAHDGFPAYEIYVNGATIYRYDPGPPPYTFRKHVRKLLPPLDIAISEMSGELP